MEENKKYYLDVLEIILGTRCNLKCRHCMGGSPPNHLTMKMSCIDNLTPDIYGINKLSFIGYETTLYIPLMQEIFDKLIKSNISINKITVCTNGKVYSQELVDFFKYASTKTKYSVRNKLLISDDIFHLEQQNTDTFMANVEKYKVNLSPAIVEINQLKDIILTGNANNLSRQDIRQAGIFDIGLLRSGKCEKFVIVDEYKKMCDDNCSDGNSYNNFVMSPIVISPNGFIYIYDVRAFKDLSEGSTSEGIADISKNRLSNIIELSEIIKNVTSCDYDNLLNFQINDSKWKFDYGLFKIISVEEKYVEVFENRNDIGFKILDRIAASKNWYLSIENPNKLPNVSKILYSLYLNEIENIKSIRIFFNYLKPSTQNMRFEDYRKRIFNRHSETVSAITEIWGDYNVWRKKWQAYENWDIDEFAKNTEYILQELDRKINTKEV